MNIQGLLVEVAEYLQGHADVHDGQEGFPAPNRAMTLLRDVEEGIAQMEQENKRELVASAVPTGGTGI